MKKTLITSTLASLLLLMTWPAQAAVLTFGYVGIGELTYSGTSLPTAASLTLPEWEIINNVAGFPSLSLGTSVLINPLTLPVENVNTAIVNPANLPAYVTFSDGVVGYSFDLDTVIFTSTGSDNLAFTGVGLFTAGNAQPVDAAISGALTQATPNSVVNGSFTIATVPEPSFWGLMSGMGILGFGVYRKLTH